MTTGDIVLFGLVITAVVVLVVWLVHTQKTRVVEWLKYATADAEQQLGSGTGQLKLRLVYNQFVKNFPIISAVVPFATFSSWVDVALDVLREWLVSNEEISSWVEEYKRDEK